MTPDELGGYADQLGPPVLAVVFLVGIVLPIVWRAFKSEDGGKAMAVEVAVLRKDVDQLRKDVDAIRRDVDDDEKRIDGLEKPRQRPRS